MTPHRCRSTLSLLALACAVCGRPTQCRAEVFSVGPDRPYASPDLVPWERLAAGDIVEIAWRPEPYRAKWVIARSGTREAPIVIRGLPGPSGQRPVIDGKNAVTAKSVDYWSEARGIIKIGGANVLADITPQWIRIENLELRGARPPNFFLGRSGITPYEPAASAVYVEKGEHIVIRNCVIHDCGNGLFSAHATRDLLVEHCYLYDNGIEGNIYHHNSYTAGIGLTVQFNRFGLLRDGCPGNNVKDRSAGFVARYNWIEGGNRQLDLVDASDDPAIASDAAYRQTFVYGNVLIEPPESGNPQIVHYGGDSGDDAAYRKGTLHFAHNTVVSLRLDKTTLICLSSEEESAAVDNNIIFTAAPGERLALLDGRGTLRLRSNWIKSGWRRSHAELEGRIAEEGTITGPEPGFAEPQDWNFELFADSPCRDAGVELPALQRFGHTIDRQFARPLGEAKRIDPAPPDLGAFPAPTDHRESAGR